MSELGDELIRPAYNPDTIAIYGVATCDRCGATRCEVADMSIHPRAGDSLCGDCLRAGLQALEDE